MKKLTILTPVFNEEENLQNYFLALKTLRKTLNNYTIEVVLIDDGSQDRSWELIQIEANINEEIKAIKLSRNHGSHTALSVGFNFSTGDAVCTLACDLQDPPQVINQFVNEWEKGCDIVWGKRRSRKDKGWKKITSRGFENLIRKYAAPKGSKFATGSFFLASKKVVNYYNKFQEHNRITFAVFAHLGFRQSIVEYDREKRIAGKSGWNFSKMIKALYDALVAFSFAPANFLRWFSLSAILLFVPIAIYAVFLYLSGRSSNIGWVSTILIVYFFGALILFNLSVILDYLIRIYLNSSQRPIYFIDKTLNNPGIVDEKS